MIKTPLKKVNKTYQTVFMMWGLMLSVYSALTVFVFPLYNDTALLIYLISLFVATFFAHMCAMCRDPGYLEPPTNVEFMAMLEHFDPVLLCPECMVIRTDRSKHCSYCNRCVERFDHHCPWINNCIGTGNHGYFAVFIVMMYTLLISTISVTFANLNCYENAVPPANQP